jgi:uncharacterized membrane protein YfcA
VPPLLAFTVSFFTSMAGVSGAFLLLPFQVSVLGTASPSASATNHLFNIIATPGGIYRFIKEGRMLWPLAGSIIVGSLPGVLLGTWIRVEFLPGPREFRLFAGCVLLCIGLRFLLEIVRASPEPTLGAGRHKITLRDCGVALVRFDFDGNRFVFRPYLILLISCLVGIAAGAYGVGGGVMIAPLLVSFVKLPIHVLAGATLLGTLAASVASVAVYQFLAPHYPQLTVAPDWTLGVLFGVGGLVGTWSGGICQKYVAPRWIKLILCSAVLIVAGRYLVQNFCGVA